jgi:hypothetical protein
MEEDFILAGHLNRAGETLMRELPRVAYPGSSSRLTGQQRFFGDQG